MGTGLLCYRDRASSRDCEMISWYTSTHKTSFFTRSFTSTRIAMYEVRESIVWSVVLLRATIKEAIGNDQRVMKERATEEERIDMLKEFFGHRVGEEQQNGISRELRLAGDTLA
jgi:arylamine N-acetyltransferase